MAFGNNPSLLMAYNRRAKEYIIAIVTVNKVKIAPTEMIDPTTP